VAEAGCYRPRVKISVVIPALDESDQIAATLAALTDPARSECDGVDATTLDVVVVDGGSRDGTPELARAHKARVVESAPGRARQLQRGLESTAGETVLFLHADTRMPAGWAGAVETALADPRVAGGAFELTFGCVAGTDDHKQRALRRVEWGARLRSRLLGLPYGDQALFARRSALDAIGGVPQARVMEDLDLVARLRETGRIALLPLVVETSPRRYLETGIARTVARHFIGTLGWACGAPRERLASWLGR
jgi:rSAM/selenodomain-associated transferase 2